MKVVSDTSPIGYLLLIGQVDLLAALFERIHIALAEEMDADLVLLDEKRARQVARQRGRAITGLLGVLDRAAQAGLVPLEDAIERLRRTNFRVEPRLIQALFDRHMGDRTAPEGE